MEKSHRPPPIRLPKAEFAFYELPEAEMQACLEYECSRERIKSRRQAILNEAKAIESRVDDEDEKFTELLELQDELNSLRELPTEPWLSLWPRERAELAVTKRPDWSEPVRLFSELSRIGQIVSRRDRLDCVINWSQSEKKLKKSFGKLIRRLRQTPGTRASLTPIDDGRGPRISVKGGLLRLVIWRCSKAGMNPDRILRLLDLFRRSDRYFEVPAEDTLRKKLKSLAREGERMVFPFGQQ